MALNRPVSAAGQVTQFGLGGYGTVGSSMNWTEPRGSRCRLSMMPIIAGRLRPVSVVIDRAASVMTCTIRVGLNSRLLCSTPCSMDTIKYWSRRMRCRSEPSPMYRARQKARASRPYT